MWTDERLDERFDAIDRRFDEVDRRLDGIDARLLSLDGRLSGLQRTMLQTNAVIIAALFGILATQL